MNIKYYTLTLIFATACASLSAEIRNTAEAEAIALDFLSQGRASAKGHVRNLRLLSSTDSLHVFSNTEGHTVFVSGSTLLRPILGWTDQPLDPEAGLSENFTSWLQSAKDAVATVEANPFVSPLPYLTASNPVVEPLLGEINWNQASPYNAQCPVIDGSTAPVGCVATAQAQVMYYHRYAVGKGSVWYRIAHGDTIDVTFTPSYDFSKMADQGRYATDKAELARFNYHVAASLYMGFTGSSSGTMTELVVNSLVNNFSYNPYIVFVNREWYDYIAWNALLQHELLNKRPLLYRGQTSSSGHAFILDGVDADGYYHVNWGWGGMENGYFDINILATNDFGAGSAADAKEGYRYNQGVCINFQPTATLGQDGIEATSMVYASWMGNYKNDNITLTKGDKATIHLNGIVNYNYLMDKKGSYGVLICDENDNVVRKIAGGELSFLPYSAFMGQDFRGIYGEGEADTTLPLACEFEIPVDLADGNYRVYVYYTPSYEASIAAPIHTDGYLKNYVALDITGDEAQLHYNLLTKPELSASAFSVGGSSLYRGQSSTASVKVTNNGSDAYGKLVMVWKETGGTKESAGDVFVFKAGQTVTFTTDYKPSNIGQATAYLCWYGQTENRPVGTYSVIDSISYDVIASNVAGADLRLAKSPFIAEGNGVINSELTVGVPLMNEGNAYSGNLQIRFYAADDASKTIVLTLTDWVDIAEKSSDTVYVKGIITDALSVGTTYYGSVWYFGEYDYSIIPTSGLTTRNRITLTPAAVSAITEVKADDSNDASDAIFNLQGQRVGTGYRGLVIQNGQLLLQR